MSLYYHIALYYCNLFKNWAYLLSNTLEKYISVYCLLAQPWIHSQTLILLFEFLDFFLEILYVQEIVAWPRRSQFFENFWGNIWHILSRPIRRCLRFRWHHKRSRISLERRMRLSLVTIFREARFMCAMHLYQREIIPTAKSIYNLDDFDSIAIE